MVFFDKFDEANFEVDNQELDIQAVTVSEIKKEYAELGTLRFWSHGEQTARKDGTIISRTYKTLTFANNAIDFDFMDLGYTDPSIGDRYQWRVIQEFTEKERYSSCDKAFGDFKIWEVSTNEYQMEITYNNKPTVTNNGGTQFEEDDDELAIFKWDRPKETNTGPGLTCPANSSIAEPGFTLPGLWVLLSSEPGSPAVGNNPGTPSSRVCERYEALPKPYYRIYDAGKALGVVKGNTDQQPDNVYISNQPNLEGIYEQPEGSGAQTDPYRMTKRYIIFEWLDAGRDDLTTFELTMVGNEVYRIFTPISRDMDPECPEHPNTVPYKAHAPLGVPTRYKPPDEFNFPDNFWNDTVDTVIENFNERSTVTPSSQ